MNFKFRHLSTVVNPREYVLYTESTITKLIAGLSQRTYLALNFGFKSAGDEKGKGDFPIFGPQSVAESIWSRGALFR